MSLSVAFVDNQNGTATATVAGNDSGAQATVYACPISPPNVNAPAWASQGSLVGNGSLSISAAALYYYGYVGGTVSGSPAVSVPTLFSISAAAEAVQEQVEAALQARIQQLALNGLPGGPGNLPSSRVYRLTTISDETLGTAQVKYPCVIVATAHVPEGQEGILTGVDDIAYPVNVVLLDRSSPKYKANAATYRLWRQQIFRALRNQRLPGASTIYNTKIEPQPVLDWRPGDYQLMGSGMLVRAISREPRGLGA